MLYKMKLRKKSFEEIKKCMKKYLDFLIKGFYAGILISIGGIAYLSIENKIVGSFIFSLGLLTICIYSFNLYTGKVGYILVNKINYVVELLLSLLGNLLGTFTIGTIMRLTRFKNYIDTATNIVNIKLNDTPLSIFILSVMCGMIMYIAVNNYKKENDIIGKYITIFMGVMAFILCGFEHCVANMFYFCIAGVFSLKVVGYLLIMILGNSVGSILIALPYNRYAISKKNKD